MSEYSKKPTKLKLLYIMDYLQRKSDEDNPVSVDELMAMLTREGIDCERKSVYSDIKILKAFGMDIDTARLPKSGYCLLSRDFELPELRLLIDAVQAANFITPKKTKELIDKIGTLCSDKQKKNLDGQVYIEKRVKCANEEIYYYIDKIHRAITANKQISFIYSKRTISEDGTEIAVQEKEHCVSPYAMIWSNDHYYLVGNNEKYDNLMHLRIDRMKKVEITEKKSRSFTEVSGYKRFFDSADYSGKTFNMFSGDTQRLEICCDNSILEEILDRFGTDATIRKISEERFTLSSRCVVSEGLVSWIMQFGSKIEVVSPKSLKEDVKKRAEEILGVYKN
ncbi:MAG: WYL domain-containing transcriptional regulator [Clostridia bacterium]|nr:WYL domain-containing transcriptional regulator [Clostridia bacterium]